MAYVSDDPAYSGDQSYLRLGTEAEVPIDPDTRAIAHLQIEYWNRIDELFLRQGYVGVGNESLGTLTFGRQYGAYTQVSDFTDWLYEFGGEASGTGTDIFGTGKCDNLVKYAGRFGSTRVEASYQIHNTEESWLSHWPGRPSGFGVSIVETLTPSVGTSLELGAAHNLAERLDPGAEHARFTAFAVRLRHNGLYAAALVAFGENWDQSNSGERDTHYRGNEILIGYEPEDEQAPGLSLFVGLNRQHARRHGIGTDTYDYYLAALQYRFSAHLRVFAEYQHQNLPGEHNALALAAVLEF